jgi:hypothetical protein
MNEGRKGDTKGARTKAHRVLAADPFALARAPAEMHATLYLKGGNGT